jgi:hypothetical protein
MEVTEELAYFVTELIVTVKSFIAKTLGPK